MTKTITTREAAQAMRDHGGSFFKAVGEAWMLADDWNRERLEKGFAEEFKRYADFAASLKAKNNGGQANE